MEQIKRARREDHLSRILERGERIVIARAGRSVADLVPHTGPVVRLGTLKGRGVISSDAFAWPDRDVEGMFYGADDPSRHE